MCFAVLKAVVSHQGMKNASSASKVQSGIYVEAIKLNHMNLICSQCEAVTKGLIKLLVYEQKNTEGVGFLITIPFIDMPFE